jgi:hypothetical protein
MLQVRFPNTFKHFNAYTTQNSYLYTSINFPMTMESMLNPFARFLSSLFPSILKAHAFVMETH